MKIGVVGLGRMGMAIVHRLFKDGHEVVCFDPNTDATQEASRSGARVVNHLEMIPQEARSIWIMVPAGKAVDEVISSCKPYLQKGDIIIDGGNSHFPDSIRRSEELLKDGIHFLDCGVSGGLKGKEFGFSLMIGGDKKAYETAEPLFKSLAAPGGYAHLGKSGAGHYVKMVHNGIEYALLQSYAEGFHLLREGRYKDLDLAKVAAVWGQGSVIRSWIVDLCQDIFIHDQHLKNVTGEIEENLTGRWTLEEAEEQKIPVKLIQEALEMRSWSRKTGGNFGTKVVALLRNAFGGHHVGKK